VKLESLAYALFGNNLIVGAHIRRQLAFLEEIVPPSWKHRQMDDLGCGDGKVTVLLEAIFQPARLRGFDCDAGLVRRARRRGIDAAVADLDGSMPGGELAVMWGVLHHLQDAAACLRRLKESYPLVFLREPLRGGFDPLELGHPMKKEELTVLVEQCLPGAGVHFHGNSALVFYARPGYLD